MKPSADHVIVNGLRFDKIPDQPFLRVAIYRCEIVRRELRIHWSAWSEGWVLLGLCGKVLSWNADIDKEIRIADWEELDPYLSDEEWDRLGKVIEVAMLKK